MDDILFTGVRIILDLRQWLQTDAPARATVVVAVMVSYAKLLPFAGLKRNRVAMGLERCLMLPFADWFPLALAGVTFTTLGALKLYGLRRGIVGGRDRPFAARLCGT
jgi:hypothetical protein